METLLQDIRYGIRMLLKNPAVTVTAVLTLALGIGANTAVFSAVNGLMLRPLPVQNADRLAVIAGKLQGSNGVTPISYLDYLDLRAQATDFSDVFAYNLNLGAMQSDGKADPLLVNYVSGNYFQALGLRPVQGRLIYGDETEKVGTNPVIVLDYGYWKSRFNSDPSVIGRQVKVNGHTATVIGVTPESFHGLYSLVETQAYMPMGMRTMLSDNNDFFTRRDARDLTVLGVLKPGVSLRQAQTAVDVVMQRLTQQYPENKGVTAGVFSERLSRPEPDPDNGLLIVSVLFTALAGMVLLLACTNVANILLVRATTRQREMAVRAALGAARSRLVRQLLTESIVLAVIGGAAGLLLGALASHLMSSIHMEALGKTIRFDLSFDWRVFTFGVGAALLTGLIVGCTPAWRLSRTDLNKVLHEGSRGVLSGTNRSPVRSLLVIGQVAGSVALLVIAGLFVRSARNAERVDLGFDPSHVLNLSMDPRSIGLTAARSNDFYRDLEARVRVLPGVESVSVAATVPMGYVSSGSPVYVEGRTANSKDAAPTVLANYISTGYFTTMRIPILRGRVFNEQDTETSLPVAIINEVMAQRYWPGKDPVGQRFSLKGPAGPFVQVVGLARQGKYNGQAEDPAPFYYLPQTQRPSSFRTLQVRTAGLPEAMIPEVERQIAELAPGLPVIGVETMLQTLEGGNGLFLFRMGTMFTLVLGTLGLVLAVVGVYGVISYAAAQRTHEIGVRMALGANRTDILKMVARQGLVLVGSGILAGLLLTFVAGRAISSFLVGVRPGDPLTLGLVTLMLMVVGLAATLAPARRAMRIEPLQALKYE